MIYRITSIKWTDIFEKKADVQRQGRWVQLNFQTHFHKNTGLFY